MAAGLSIGLFMFSLLVVGIKAENVQIGRTLKALTNDPYKRLFVFGDSFADTGNLQNPNDPYTACRYPYSETYPGHWTGRWSDGKLLTDFVAAYMGLPVSPVLYSQRGQNVTLQQYGMNFAYAGSGVFNTFKVNNDTVLIPNMTQQIDWFEQLIQSGLYAQHLNSSVALVTYSGNDYAAYLGVYNGTLLGADIFRRAVVQQLARNLQRLHGLGVNRIAVTNLQPLGCSPTIASATSYTRCVALFNLGSAEHNLLLRTTVGALSPPVVILDNYNAFQTVLQQANFGNTLKGCCMGVNISVWCGTVDGNGNPLYTLCSNPSSTFWWDNNHPTQAAWGAVVQYHQSSLDQLLA